MQDEKNNNQPVILNLNPVNDSISQFIHVQTGILSEQEIFVPSDSILPVGTRVKIEYRLKNFGQKENVKIIDAIGEVIGPEIDSEKGRRGVKVKFLKLSPTSQMLVQKLLEKIKAVKPSSGEKKITEETKPASGETKIPATSEPQVSKEPEVEVEEPKVEISEPPTTTEPPTIKINEPSPTSEQTTPSISDVMSKLELDQKKETPVLQTEQKPASLAEIMSMEIKQPEGQEINTGDDKQAQFVFEYLPPGQPIEENTGIVKIREIVRSTDISNVKRTSRIWIALLIIILLVAGAVAFFLIFPQYAPRIFVRSHEVSNVITKRDLTPEIQPAPAQPAPQQPAPNQAATASAEKKDIIPQEKKEEKAEEKKVEVTKEEKKEIEKAAEPEIQPLAAVEEKAEKKDKKENIKIISASRIKKEREKEKKVQEKKAEIEKEQKKEKAEVEKEQRKKEAQIKKEAKSIEPGKVIIQITPTDADLTISIDGTQVGTMPTLAKQIQPGPHTIKVVADGYNEEVRKIDLGEGETRTIKINLKEK